ncbi:MAG: SPOR domain-containing protein [Shewanella sp.]
MSSQFHNRLVGTVVLVALGVIFLPDILDGKKDRKEEQFAEIPLRPVAIAQNHAQGNSEDLPADMFEALPADDIAQGVDDGAVDSDGELVASAPAGAKALPQVESKTLTQPAQSGQHLTPAAPAKATVSQAQPVNTAATAPKKEAPKPTVTKTEPAKKPETKSTTVAKTDKTTAEKATPVKPKAEAPKPAVKDEIRVVSRESLNKPGLTLQLGAFSNAANVQGLVAQLRKNGFKAYTVPSTPKDGVLTKVFVGPDISEAKLKKMQEDIEARLRLKGRIVPFNPLES